MSSEITGSTIYLLAGQSTELRVESEYANKGPVVHNGQTRELKRGFLVEDTTVGEITDADIPQEDGCKVKYTHYKAQNNSIYFYSAKGNPYDIGLINVVAVPLHDHSSIVQGGPAYGTYFSDDMVVREET
jgi:hypothetical protein